MAKLTKRDPSPDSRSTVAVREVTRNNASPLSHGTGDNYSNYPRIPDMSKNRILRKLALLAAVGEADIKDKLLAGHEATGKTFKAHLDG